MSTKSLLFKLLVTCMQLSQTTSRQICLYNPDHDCPDVIALGSNVTCTCTCKLEGRRNDCVDDPKSAISIGWNETNSRTLHLANVQQKDQGRVFHCVMNEYFIQLQVSEIHQSPYTVKVAQPYGPSGAQASGPSTQDVDGQTPITLQCSASNTLPPATYSWSRVISEGTNHTFIPTPEDDGAVFVCEATNPMTGSTQSDRVVVNLQYPPSSPPTITSNATSERLYEGDSVTLTCKVSGGKPHVSYVTFSCPGKTDSHDVTMADGVSSTVIFDRLTLADNLKTCLCTARWKNSDLYTLQAFISLSVLAAEPVG